MVDLISKSQKTASEPTGTTDDLTSLRNTWLNITQPQYKTFIRCFGARITSSSWNIKKLIGKQSCSSVIFRWASSHQLEDYFRLNSTVNASQMNLTQQDFRMLESASLTLCCETFAYLISDSNRIFYNIYIDVCIRDVRDKWTSRLNGKLLLMDTENNSRLQEKNNLNILFKNFFNYILKQYLWKNNYK